MSFVGRVFFMRTHGLCSTYNNGCRCDLCREAARESWKAKAVRRAARITGSDVPAEYQQKKSKIHPGDSRERVVTTIGGAPNIANISTAAIGAFAGDVVVVEYSEHSILIRRKVDLST